MSEVVKIPPVMEAVSAYASSNTRPEATPAVSASAPASSEGSPVGNVQALEIARKEQQARQAERMQKEEQIAKVLAEKYSFARNVRLQFEVDRPTERVIIRVMDRDSGELIRQIPPEEMMDLARVLSENLKGMLVDNVT